MDESEYPGLEKIEVKQHNLDSEEAVEEFRRALVKSNGCKDTDITYKITRITDDQDDDKNDFVNLTFYLNCSRIGQPINRRIYSLKVAIPEEVKLALKRYVKK